MGGYENEYANVLAVREVRRGGRGPGYYDFLLRSERRRTWEAREERLKASMPVGTAASTVEDPEPEKWSGESIGCECEGEWNGEWIEWKNRRERQEALEEQSQRHGEESQRQRQQEEDIVEKSGEVIQAYQKACQKSELMGLSIWEREKLAREKAKKERRW